MEIIKADGKREYEFLKRLDEKRFQDNKNVTEAVMKIIEDVRLNKDKAVREYTKKFDKVSLDSFELDRSVMENSLKDVDKEFLDVLYESAENIRKFHEKQLKSGFEINENGKITGQIVRPLERVGIYVPGGTAAYPSSVLMNAVVAKVAKVKEVIMVTPYREYSDLCNILAAAYVSGVDRVFTIGGAQAVSALAYGTETIPKVDKIVGPGNIYVATAKKLLYGVVDIDMIAGPSEILILADENANPKFLAADMMSQAEHDVLASSILLCLSEDMAKKTYAEIERQLEYMPRADIIKKSLDDCGAVIICDNIESMIDLANEIAPEHLELAVDNALSYVDKIKNAGSVFCGNYSPEPLGDYFAGPNHVLPTTKTARFFSPLNAGMFQKSYSYISYSKDALMENGKKVELFANKEGLYAHANSITVRLEND